MLQKGSQKWSLNRQKPNWNLDRIPVLLFIIFGTQNGAHNRWKQLNSLCKTSISEKYPFPIRGSLGLLKSHKNSTKTTPKPLQKSSRKHIEIRHQNSLILGSKWPPNELRNPPKVDPGGAVGPHWTKEAQEGGPAPPGDPKRRSRSPPGHHFYHFWDLFWMFSNIIHDLLSTMPNYVYINIQRQKMKE